MQDPELAYLLDQMLVGWAQEFGPVEMPDSAYVELKRRIRVTAVERTQASEREHAAALCNAWGHYWAKLYTSKLEPVQVGMIGYALGEKIKAGESLDVVKAAQEQLDIERMPKRRKRL